MKRLRAARQRNGERKNQWPHWHPVMRVGIGLLTWAALSLILLGYNLFPGRLSLRVGEPSPLFVRAPRMAQYVDQVETERLRREAESRVSPQYSPLPYARADAEKRVSQDFTALREAKESASTPDAVRKRLAWVPAESAEWLVSAPAKELERLEEETRGLVREVMGKEIREGTGDIRAAKEGLQTLAYRRQRSPGAAALIAQIAKRDIAPNRRLDSEAEEAARAEARQRVQEVVRTIDADQLIIFEDERVTREHLDMLRALGLASPRLDYRRLLSTVLIVGLIVLLLGLQTRSGARHVYEKPKWLLLLSLLAVASLFVMNLITLALPNAWMLIVPAAALMAAALLADSIGMALALALSLLVGLMANAGLPAVLLALGSAATALAFSSQLWPVSRLRVVVGAMAATNLVLVAAVGLLQSQQVASITREALLAAGLYSPGAAVLALGGIYMLQRPFGITTHLSLLELLNPQTPLLKRLQAEAPGTYHHAMMVANLAEGAAEAVGADALLTRVGALYHDIGKLYRPAFFVENQALLGVDNVHDRLSSSLSGLIIVSHVKDGVALAQQYRLPPEVVNIIAEHHGATTMSYFYHQALSGARPEDVSEDQFRYPGPLPSTKEAALVMLADAVHAAAKSIEDPTPQRVQQMVREIARERVVGGQMEHCDLTFREVSTAEAVMNRVLTAELCRNRIAYPERVEGGVGL
ncbi:MAG TPA: HDIG domain-containing protein [Armatimonadota bacterium]|nr:HDIG domain-containing protein [Armatimonadota bacterium]